MKYKFALNLQRMALSSKARSLWEQEEIQNKVMEFFKYEYMRSTYSDAERKQQEEKWHSITKEVLGRLEFHILPAKLESELMYVIREVGAKIYNWYAYVKEACSYEKLEEYTKQIYWTHYGNIDEIKIFKSFWLKNHRLDISNIYEMACNYCLEEYTNNLWQQIPKEKRKSDFYTDTIYEKYQYHLIAYWQCYLDGDLKYLVRYFKRFDSDYKKIYNRHYSVEENIFKLSVYQGYSKAVRYFWDKLSDEEKDRNILDSAYTVINEFHKYRSSYNEIGNYTREQYTDICTFLISKMSISQQQELFMSYDSSILKMFLSHWPWQELLIPTLERMWHCVDGGSYQSLLNGIMDKIRKDQELGYGIENSKYQRILHEIWHKSPACLKQKIDQSNYDSSNITTQLLDIWDLSTLKLIINDQDMVQRRWELIDKGRKKYVRLVEEDKYELLEQFIGEIFSAAEEQKSFKQKIDIWHFFIIGDYSGGFVEGRYYDFKIISEYRGRYDLADKLLDWQCSSEEERSELKSKIDHIDVCYYFIALDRYDLADKFLGWCLESAEEIKNCKDSFQDNQFSVDHIYRLWAVRKEDVEIVREKSNNFLNWFLNSEEEIARFKQEKLIKNNELKEILCHKFIGYNCFEIVEYFLEWCLLPQEEIKQLKQILIDRNLWQQCKWDIAGGFLDIAERFVKWAFDTEDKRIGFIKKFMVSDNGGLSSCNAMIKRASDVDPHNPRPTLEERLVKFNKFIDFWLRPLYNLNEIKGKIQSFVSSYREEEQIEDHQIFMSVLDNLEQSSEMMEVSYMGASSNMEM